MVSQDVVPHLPVPEMNAGSGSILRVKTTFHKLMIPHRKVDVDVVDRHAMVAGVAHQLGRGVEAHRLGIEQRAGEDVRVAALHPGRGIDQEREGGGVALRKAVGAETLDLLEAIFGEFLRVARPTMPSTIL